jgi:SH3 type 3 domain protein
MSDAKIKVGADVSAAEKELNKLQKKFEDVDKASENIGDDISLQKAKELKQLAEDMEKSLGNFEKQQAKLIQKLAQEQERLNKKLEGASKKAQKEKIQSQIDEKRKQRDMADQALRDAKRLHELKKKQVDEILKKSNQQGSGGGQGSQGGKGNKLMDVMASGRKSMGIGNSIAGMFSGQGLMQGLLGAVGGGMAIALGAVVAGWSLLVSKFGKPAAEKDKTAYELFQGNQIYGNNYTDAKNSVRTVGRQYNYKTQESLDTASAYLRNRDVTSKEQLETELDAIMKYSRSVGIKPDDIAGGIGKLSSLTGSNATQLTALLDSSANALGMNGRQGEVLEVLERIATNSAATNDILSDEHLKGYMEFASQLTKNGMDGSQALDKALSASELLSGNKSLEGLYVATMMKETGRSDIGAINEFRQQVQSKDPEVQRKMVEILTDTLGGDRDTAIAFLSQNGMVNTAKNAMDMMASPKLDTSNNNIASRLLQYNTSQVGTLDNWDAMKDTGANTTGNIVNSITGAYFSASNPYTKGNTSSGSYGSDRTIGFTDRTSEEQTKLLTQIEMNTSSQVKEQEKANKLTEMSEEDVLSSMIASGMVSPGLAPMMAISNIAASSSSSYVNPDKLIQGSAGKSGKFTIHDNMDRTMDTRKYTPEEVEQLIDAMVSPIEKRTGKRSALRGTGKAFVDASERTGMGVEAALAMAMFESDGGTSKQAREKNNFFGWGSYNGASYMAHSFASNGQGVETVMGKIASNYIFSSKNNQTTPYELTFGNNGNGSHKYNVGNEAGWANGVNGYRNQIANTSEKLFGKQVVEVKVSGEIKGVSKETEQMLVQPFKDNIMNTNLTRGN